MLFVVMQLYCKRGLQLERLTVIKFYSITVLQMWFMV